MGSGGSSTPSAEEEEHEEQEEEEPYVDGWEKVGKGGSTKKDLSTIEALESKYTTEAEEEVAVNEDAEEDKEERKADGACPSPSYSSEEWDDDEEGDEYEDEDEECFQNICKRCGFCWALAVEIGESFVCEDLGVSCDEILEMMQIEKREGEGAGKTDGEGENDEDEEERQLTEEEEKRERAIEMWVPGARFINNEIVLPKKGTDIRWVVEKKESAEFIARTSVKLGGIQGYLRPSARLGLQLKHRTKEERERIGLSNKERSHTRLTGKKNDPKFEKLLQSTNRRGEARKSLTGKKL